MFKRLVRGFLIVQMLGFQTNKPILISRGMTVFRLAKAAFATSISKDFALCGHLGIAIWWRKAKVLSHCWDRQKLLL